MSRQKVIFSLLGSFAVLMFFALTLSWANTYSEEPKQEGSEAKIAFLKDSAIFVADIITGKSEQVYVLEKEETKGDPTKFYMRLSPDKRHVAYISKNNAIKVIDIEKKQLTIKYKQESSRINNFAWSPDSKRLTLSLTKSDKGKVTSSIIIIDITDQKPSTINIPQTNIRILQLEWPQKNYLCYSHRYQMPNLLFITGVTSINIEDNSHKTREFPSPNYANIFFTLSPDKDKILMYRYGQVDVEETKLSLLSFPTLQNLPIRFDFNKVGYFVYNIKWSGDYLTGLAISSPDIFELVYNFNLGTERIAAAMGPSGDFYDVFIMQQSEKVFLVSWSSFDQKHNIYVYEPDEEDDGSFNKIRTKFIFKNAYSLAQ